MMRPLSTHDPATFPICEKALTSATATARLDGGRGNELLTHVYMTTKPAYCCAIKNLEATLASWLTEDTHVQGGVSQ